MLHPDTDPQIKLHCPPLPVPLSPTPNPPKSQPETPRSQNWLEALDRVFSALPNVL